MTRSTDNSPPFRQSHPRRQFIKGIAAGLTIWQFNPMLAHAVNFSTSPNALKRPKKLIWVMLRGALDGLHTVVPQSDPHLSQYRPTLYPDIQSDLLPLNAQFGLHPSLTFMHEMYKLKQMSPIIATASGYRDRSHFDAQDQMESGLDSTEHDNGWLGRAVHELNREQRAGGLAIAQSVPVALRYPDLRADTWYPSRFRPVEDDLLARLSALYEDDMALHAPLMSLIAQKANPAMNIKSNRKTQFPDLAQRCGKLLAKNPQTQCAMLEMGGWDTHNGQAGRLARNLQKLDKGMTKLHHALGDSWDDTLVIINTEFGRTVRENGTRGTDHGTASTMFVMGGALSQSRISMSADTDASNSAWDLTGGRVLGQWPGLAETQLFEGRDLQPTSDHRFWLGLALQHQWGLTSEQMQNIFPDITV